jgi:hypothetical protein
VAHGHNSFLTKGLATLSGVKNGTVSFRGDSRDRLLERIAKAGDCWEWLGHKSKAGYGLCYIGNGFSIGAHRLSYLLFKGPIGEKYVCHSCDNPACVNPEHLWLGSNADNMNDAVAKGRRIARRMTESSGPQRRPGRPRLGDYRLEMTVPQAVLDRLEQLEAERGIYRTRIAAEILINELVGGVVHRS